MCWSISISQRFFDPNASFRIGFLNVRKIPIISSLRDRAMSDNQRWRPLTVRKEVRDVRRCGVECADKAPSVETLCACFLSLWSSPPVRILSIQEAPFLRRNDTVNTVSISFRFTYIYQLKYLSLHSLERQTLSRIVQKSRNDFCSRVLAACYRVRCEVVTTSNGSTTFKTILDAYHNTFTYASRSGSVARNEIKVCNIILML